MDTPARSGGGQQRKAAELQQKLKADIAAIGQDRSKLNQQLIDIATQVRGVETRIGETEGELRPLDSREQQVRASLDSRRDTRFFAIENDSHHIGNVWLADIDARHRKAEVPALAGVSACQRQHCRFGVVGRRDREGPADGPIARDPHPGRRPPHQHA